jgi:hypothetical protein
MASFVDEVHQTFSSAATNKQIKAERSIPKELYAKKRKTIIQDPISDMPMEADYVYESSVKKYVSEFSEQIYKDADYFTQEKCALLSEAIHYQYEQDIALTYNGLICAIMTIMPGYIMNMDASNPLKQKEIDRWQQEIRISIIDDLNDFLSKQD